jgi:hydroxypyruvate isomerase
VPGLRFTGVDQNDVMSSCRSIDFQPAAKWVLTVWVSSGGNPKDVLKPYMVGRLVTRSAADSLRASVTVLRGELAMPEIDAHSNLAGEHPLNRGAVLPTDATESVAVAAVTDTSAAQHAVKNGRIKQSLTFWCLNGTDCKWDVDQICATAKRLGCHSVELVPPELWSTLRKYGLQSALAPNGMPDPAFRKGVNNPRYHEEVITRTKLAIDQAAGFGIPNVIAFTGYKWHDSDDPTSGIISLEEGAVHSVKALAELGKYAAEKNVTVCLEQLNTRDNSHPMKGHPGYQGDNLDYCANLVKDVHSTHVKLLFDIYHVDIMNGDVIRRLRQYHDIIGHVHTAGNPGRGELDDRQEINYPAVMRALLEVGYAGYVGQEFIPRRDPLVGLWQAVSLCDVA